MGLRDYELPSEIVPIDEKNSFVVRGISFEDVTKLVNRYGPFLALIYTKIIEMKAKDDLRPETLGMLVQQAFAEFPDAVADLIAMAAEEPDQVQKIKRLPTGIQLDAIDKIMRLTFAGEGDIKKLVETVTRMVVGLKGGVDRLTAPTLSDSGIGAFASR